MSPSIDSMFLGFRDSNNRCPIKLTKIYNSQFITLCSMILILWLRRRRCYSYFRSQNPFCQHWRNFWHMFFFTDISLYLSGLFVVKIDFTIKNLCSPPSNVMNSNQEINKENALWIISSIRHRYNKKLAKVSTACTHVNIWHFLRMIDLNIQASNIFH